MDVFQFPLEKRGTETFSSLYWRRSNHCNNLWLELFSKVLTVIWRIYIRFSGIFIILSSFCHYLISQKASNYDKRLFNDIIKARYGYISPYWLFLLFFYAFSISLPERWCQMTFRYYYKNLEYVNNPW